MHVGSDFGLCGPNWITKDTNKDLGASRNKGQKIIYKYWQFFANKCKEWDADSFIFFGDIINGVNFKQSGLRQMTSDIDEQVDHAISLIKPIINDKPSIHLSGSGYHGSKDTRVHRRIAKDVGGKFLGGIANVKLEGTSRILNIAHGTSQAYVYRTMIMSRESLFMAEAMAFGKVPRVDMLIRGHMHHFIHIHQKGMHMLQLPCWKAYEPWRGTLGAYGKFQPDIGACILLIDQKDRMVVLPFIMQEQVHIADDIWES
jgi:UDP-2,3-diacylglucosamine pyrophosphatase LpxH